MASSRCDSVKGYWVWQFKVVDKSFKWVNLQFFEHLDEAKQFERSLGLSRPYTLVNPGFSSDSFVVSYDHGIKKAVESHVLYPDTLPDRGVDESDGEEQFQTALMRASKQLNSIRSGVDK